MRFHFTGVVAQFVAGAAGSACPINSAGAVVKCRTECRETSGGWNGLFRFQPAFYTLDVYRRKGRERWLARWYT